jgi:beta-glucosidase/6-phospho-beta-glucosidase/beta-galactosidase
MTEKENNFAVPPDPFLWGVATSAYQHEGGLNGEGQPQNNWAWAERQQTVDPSGGGADFWTRAEEDFTRCRALGLNAFRLSLSWERIQPTTTLSSKGQPSPDAPPPFDEGALERYAAILATCRREGLEPVVTLHHFTHPAWLGIDAWLHAETIDHYLRYVEKTISFLLDALPRRHGVAVPRWFITINEPNMLAASTYFNGIFPKGNETPRHPKQAVDCLAHLIEAHIRAYRLIHRLYREQGATEERAPQVSFNNYCSDLYWNDMAWIDLLVAPSRGITRHQLFPYLWKQTWKFDEAFRAAHLPIQPRLRYWVGQTLKKLHHLVAVACCFDEACQRLVKVLYDNSDNPSEPLVPPIDYLALDYYDPFVAHALRWPRWNDLFHKHRHEPKPATPSLHERFLDSITNKWWDWRLLPEGLGFFVRTLESFHLPIMITESGMAYRADPRQHYGRRDNLLRSDYIRQQIAVVKQLRNEGVPLIGYLYWSLVDNYEWGSYAPRFGLYSREREAVDFRGDNASATYSEEIAKARREFSTQKPPEGKGLSAD